MNLHLYRPILWWSGDEVRLLTTTSGLSAREAAMLVRMKRATTTSNHLFGESMSDDHSSVLKLITPPVSEPLTLVQAKSFLRIEHTADDDAITRAITAARKYAESYLRLLLLPQVWEYRCANPCETRVKLPVGPAQSIASVTLTSELGAVTTMDAANYRLSVDGFTVLFHNTPSTEILKIRLTAGEFDDADEVPIPIVQGMLHHLAAMLENRDGAALLPAQAANCYQPYRRISL